MLLCVELIVGIVFGDPLLQKIRSVAMLYEIAFISELGLEVLGTKQPTPSILFIDCFLLVLI
jgi:hypothetical protein